MTVERQMRPSASAYAAAEAQQAPAEEPQAGRGLEDGEQENGDAGRKQ